MKKMLFCLMALLCFAPSFLMAGGSEEAGEGAGEMVTLTLALEGTQARRELFDEVLKEFYSRYPNIRIAPAWIQMNDWPDYFTKIQTMIAGGTPPDVARTAIEGIRFMVEKDLALPLNEYLDKHPDIFEDYQDLHPRLL